MPVMLQMLCSFEAECEREPDSNEGKELVTSLRSGRCAACHFFLFFHSNRLQHVAATGSSFIQTDLPEIIVVFLCRHVFFELNSLNTSHFEAFSDRKFNSCFAC